MGIHCSIPDPTSIQEISENVIKPSQKHWLMQCTVYHDIGIPVIYLWALLFTFEGIGNSCDVVYPMKCPISQMNLMSVTVVCYTDKQYYLSMSR